MRKWIGATLTLTLLTACTAKAESYRDKLVAKCPMYQSATGRMAPVYPALAKQIVGDYHITEGTCVDVGTGSGALGFEVAKLTKLTVYGLDIDPLAVRLSLLLADEAGLTGRFRAVEGDACDMPFRDGFAELVVSRGSIFFWPDQFKGLMECWRILKPGGVAYVGGGFSRILEPKVRDPLAAWGKRHFVDPKDKPDGWRPLETDLIDRLKAAGVKQARLDTEPVVGWWVELRK